MYTYSVYVHCQALRLDASCIALLCTSDMFNDNKVKSNLNCRLAGSI